MTLALPGFTAKLLVADLASTVFAEVAEARELTLDVEHELIDATSHDSAEFREFIRGLRNWSITSAVLHITGDVSQTKLRNAIIGVKGLALDMQLQEEVGVGKPEWTGSIFISAESISFPNDDAMVGDFTLQGTGVLTEGVQA